LRLGLVVVDDELHSTPEPPPDVHLLGAELVAPVHVRVEGGVGTVRKATRNEGGRVGIIEPPEVQRSRLGQ